MRFSHWTSLMQNPECAAMQLVSNSNVVPLDGPRTTFEIQSISIHYYSLRIHFLYYLFLNTTTFSFIFIPALALDKCLTKTFEL